MPASQVKQGILVVIDMKFLDDTQLAHYDTMRIGGPAAYIAVAETEQDILEAYNFTKAKNIKLQVIGAGSNIIFTDAGFDGLVLINKIPGLLIDQQTNQVRIGAGTLWHDAVVKTVESGLCGIEAMALIPGTCGGAPVNNIGAYGQELKDVLVNLTAFDTASGNFIVLDNSACHFSYRNSLFKSESYGRYIISSLTLQLKSITDAYMPPQYPSLQAELDKNNIIYPTPDQVMQAVINIRSAKLPDPALLANTGSFFKNPFDVSEHVTALLATYPDMPHYPQADGKEKLSAGWLIEQAGLKNHRQNGMWIYDKQALVLVNEQATSYADLEAMQATIIKAVYDKFGIALEPEPEIL